MNQEIPINYNCKKRSLSGSNIFQPDWTECKWRLKIWCKSLLAFHVPIFGMFLLLKKKKNHLWWGTRTITKGYSQYKNKTLSIFHFFITFPKNAQNKICRILHISAISKILAKYHKLLIINNIAIRHINIAIIIGRKIAEKYRFWVKKIG